MHIKSLVQEKQFAQFKCVTSHSIHMYTPHESVAKHVTGVCRLPAALSKTHGEFADTRERLEGLERRLLEANMSLVNMKTTQETLTSTLVEKEEMIKGLQADVVGLTGER